MTASNSTSYKNIYARGADDGLWLGIYLCSLFGVCVAALSVDFLNVVAFALIAGVPALIYFFLRRTHVQAHGLTGFSALWMQGIVTFACACLIFGAFSFIYLRWIDPQLILRAINSAIEAFRTTYAEGSSQMIKELEFIAANPILIAPLNLAFGWMWLGMFSGSILSLLVAGLVRLRRVPIRTDEIK